jgi:hypothetical protein
MVARSILHPVPNFDVFLTSMQSKTIQLLIEKLDSSVDLFSRIHDAAYALLTDCHESVYSNKFECLHIKHLILSQLRPGGVFATPSAISSMISRKKWHMRATGTLEAYIEKDKYTQKMFGYVL